MPGFPVFLPRLFVALIEKVCIADYQVRWQDFVAYNFQIQSSDEVEDKDFIIKMIMMTLRQTLLLVVVMVVMIMMNFDDKTLPGSVV